MKTRSTRITVGVLVMYSILVSINLGEFWPFSIYPMFSQGGNDWSRAVVREIDGVNAISWSPTTVSGLPGSPFPLTPSGIDPIDIANYVSKTQVWDQDRLLGIQSTFVPAIDDETLMIFRVNGSITPSDSVVVEFVPYLFVTRDTIIANPSLDL